MLEHDGGLQTVYAHLSAVSVSFGETVREGQELGRSGNSGNSTGAHLHFEVRRFGTPVDPETLLFPADPQNSGSRRVCVPELYVRSGPGIEYPIVDSLKQGTPVSGETTSETVWLRIGRDRWIAVRYQGKDFCETVE